MTRYARDLRPGDHFVGPRDGVARTVDFVTQTQEPTKRAMIHVKAGDRVFTFEFEKQVTICGS